MTHAKLIERLEVPGESVRLVSRLGTLDGEGNFQAEPNIKLISWRLEGTEFDIFMNAPTVSGTPGALTHQELIDRSQVIRTPEIPE